MGFSLIPSKPFAYQLPEFTGSEAPLFHLRHLSSRAFSDLATLSQKDPSRGAYVAACAGLVGWERVQEADGTPVPFVAVDAGKRRLVHGVEIEGGAAFECVDRLPFEVVGHIAAEVMRANQLDTPTAKN
jgi:hypothetical protein